MQKSNFDHANLNYSQFIGADLKNSNLENAVLKSADLTCSILQDANLKNANLSNAILVNADLRNTDLTEANLSAADLRGARNLSCPQLRLAINWDLSIRENHYKCEGSDNFIRKKSENVSCEEIIGHLQKKYSIRNKEK